MIVCTIAAENYLHKAFVLGASVRAHHPLVRTVICVPERTIHEAVHSTGLFDVILTVDDLAYPNADHFIFRHNLVELSTAIKPRVLRAALALFPNEPSVVYLDPDTVLYRPLAVAERLLEEADVLVTPHHLTPPSVTTTLPLLRHGAWNLGFLGVRRSSVGHAFLAWFTDTLDTMCYVDAALGVFVDQKWMDLAPSYFPVTILRDPSCNVGYWNLEGRAITTQGSDFMVGTVPLTFFHFSGTDLGRDQRFFRRVGPRGDEPVHELRRSYKRQIEDIRVLHRFATTWGYGFYESGEQIAREARLVVRAEPHLLDGCESPFSESNEFFLSQATTH